MIKENLIEGFLLCGGKSKRFGEDKRFLNFKGKPLILYQLEKLKRIFKDVKILVKKNDFLLKYFPREFFLIEEEKESAMMIGVLNGLKNMKGNEAFFLSVDMPLVPEEFILKIVKIKNYLGVAPFFQKKTHFGTLFLKKESYDEILKSYIEKNYSFKELFNKNCFFQWNLDKEKWILKYKNPFLNINEKKDLEVMI